MRVPPLKMYFYFLRESFFFCFVLRWRSSPAVLKNCAIPIRSPQRWSIIFNNALFFILSLGKRVTTKVMSNGLLIWALTILDDRRSLFYFWNCWIRGRLCFYFSVISISKCAVVFLFFCPFWESNEANAKVKGKKRSPLAGQAKETGRAWHSN